MQQERGRSRQSRQYAKQPRFVRLDANGSSTADLLYGCDVVAASGQKMGTVDHLIVDLLSSQLRYVVLQKERGCAEVALPWHALYFDSSAAQLVFYTLG